MDKNVTLNDQTDSTLDIDEIISLIEDLKVQINHQQFSLEQIKNLRQISAYSINKVNENFNKAVAELKTSIKPIDEKIAQIKSQQNVAIRKEHVFSIDFRNSRAALTMVTMGLVILLSFGCNIWQLNRNSLLKDNDLKYRYIKMKGKATWKDILQLETIFTYDRNRDSIAITQEQIKIYERIVKKQAEELERVKRR